MKTLSIVDFRIQFRPDEEKIRHRFLDVRLAKEVLLGEPTVDEVSELYESSKSQNKGTYVLMTSPRISCLLSRSLNHNDHPLELSRLSGLLI